MDADSRRFDSIISRPRLDTSPGHTSCRHHGKEAHLGFPMRTRGARSSMVGGAQGGCHVCAQAGEGHERRPGEMTSAVPRGTCDVDGGALSDWSRSPGPRFCTHGHGSFNLTCSLAVSYPQRIWLSRQQHDGFCPVLLQDLAVPRILPLGGAPRLEEFMGSLGPHRCDQLSSCCILGSGFLATSPLQPTSGRSKRQRSRPPDIRRLLDSRHYCVEAGGYLYLQAEASLCLSPRPCFCDTPPARDWLRPEDGRFWCRFGPAMRKIPSLRQSLSCAGRSSFRTLSIRLRNPTKNDRRPSSWRAAWCR